MQLFFAEKDSAKPTKPTDGLQLQNSLTVVTAQKKTLWAKNLPTCEICIPQSFSCVNTT